MLNQFNETNDKVKTVLIVDDDQELLVNLNVQCSSLGLTPLMASDAISAVNIMERAFPDLIILDVDMPAGSGKTFLQRLGANLECRQIPVIGLSKNADLNSIRRAPELIAYFAHKSNEAWSRIETFIHELVDLSEVSSNESHNFENPDNLNKGANQ